MTKHCFLHSPHRFSTQSSQYQNWKAKKYSILTVTELRLPVSESSTRSRNFMSSTDSKHKFHKTEIEIWPSIEFNLGPSWLGTLSHNHSTMFVQPLKSWNNPGDILLSWKCASVVKSPPPSLRVASTPNKTKSNQHGLIIYKHSTNTHTHTRTHAYTLHYASLLAVGVNGSPQIPGVTKGNLGLASLSHSTWLTPETKIWNLRFTQPPCSFRPHQEQKEKLIY